MKKSEAKKLGDDLSKYMMAKIRDHGSIEMMVYIISGHNTRVLKGFDANSHEQKSLVAELARYLSKKHSAESVIFSCESFVSYQDKSPDKNVIDVNDYRQKHGTIEGHPLTSEAVFLSIEIPGSTIVRCYPFNRDEKGAIEDFQEPIEFPEDASLDGTLSGLMNSEKRLEVPDEILSEMEKSAVEIIPTKTLGIFFNEGHSPTLH